MRALPATLTPIQPELARVQTFRGSQTRALR